MSAHRSIPSSPTRLRALRASRRCSATRPYGTRPRATAAPISSAIIRVLRCSRATRGFSTSLHDAPHHKTKTRGRMNAATKAIAAQGLARRAFSLGAVKAFDNALQFLLPVVLVRCLDTHTFGEYRLLWLAVGTVMALAPLSMPGGLYYFLPRSDAPARRLYVHQTLVFLACSGLASAFIVSPLNPWLPATLH